MRKRGLLYERRNKVNQIVFVLDCGGRQAEATDLLRCEASITQDHVRLVDRLMAFGDREAAQTTAIERLDSLDDTAHGEAEELRKRLCDLAELRGDHRLAAAYRANDFYQRPSTRTFFEAQKAAKKARCENSVRKWLEHFLETGRCPSARSFKRRKGEPAAWPLPKTDQTVSPNWKQHRGLSLLLDIAIQESKPTLALRLHGRLRSIPSRQPTAAACLDDLRLADAIAATHPRRAIEVYLAQAQQLIAETNTRFYPQAVTLLCKIRTLLLPKKKAEWTKLLNQIRTQHERKTNLMRELDRLNRSSAPATRRRPQPGRRSGR